MMEELTQSSVDNDSDSSATIQCRLCRERLDCPSDLEPHLIQEHNIQYEVESVLQLLLGKEVKSENNFPNHRSKSSTEDTNKNAKGKNDASKSKSVAIQSSESKGSQNSHNKSSSGDTSSTNKCLKKIPWFAGCEYKCKVCGKLYFYTEDLRDHIRKRHFSPNEYLEQFEAFETKSVSLRCKVCSMTIKRHYGSVWSHLNKDHGISLFEYQEKYGMHDYEVPVSPSQNGFGHDEASSDEETKKPVIQKRPNQDQNVVPHTEPKRPKLTIEPVKPATGSSPQIQPKTESVVLVTKQNSGSKLWFIGCEYRCMVSKCHHLFFDMPDMMQHIKSAHDMTARQYMDLHRKMETKFHWYTCGVCQSRVKHQRSTLVKHLETHNMNLIKYTEIFHPNELKAVAQEKRAAASAAAAASAQAPKMNYEKWSRGACKFRCAVCKFTSECSAEFWKHASHEHNLNIAEYKTELGNPCVLYKEIQCLGCNKLLRYDPGTLANHASHAHDMSMESFYEAFFKLPGSPEQPSQPEKPTKEKIESKPLTEEEKEKYDEEARQWSDQCVYDCRVCNTASYMNYGSLFDHIRSKHNISVDSYKSEYGEMATKKIMHHCRLCQVEFLHTSAIMRKHLKRCHEMSLTKYYLDQVRNNTDRDGGSPVGDASDDESKIDMDEETAASFSKWKRGCEYECKVCSSIHFSWSNLNTHLRSSHDISADEYREKHGILMTKKAYHKCYICRAPIIQETKNLKLHMQKRHELSLDEYYVKYVNLKAGLRPTPSNSPVKSAPPPVLGPSGDKNISFADWKYACRYDCKICGFSTRHSSDFSTHMNGRHGMNLAEYSKTHGRAMTIRVHHKCQICGSLIIQQPQSMKGHMTMHALTLDEYFFKYVVGDEDGSNYNNGQISDMPEVRLREEDGGDIVGAAAAPENEDFSNDTDMYQTDETTFDGDSTNVSQCDAQEMEMTVDAESQDMNDQDISYDEWRHACVYTCKICNHSSKHHADIYSHMLSKHNITIREYTERYGKAMTKEVYHNCHICGKDLLQQSKNIKKHIKSHNMPLEKYFEIYVKGGKVSQAVKSQKELQERTLLARGNGTSVQSSLGSTSIIKMSNITPELSEYARWKNACKFECKVCSYMTKAYFTFNFHVKEKHGLLIQDYIREYGKPMTKKVYHRCLICGAAFLQIAKTITRHLQLHGILLQDYYDQYVLKNDDSKPATSSAEAVMHRMPPMLTPKKAPLKLNKELRMTNCLSKSPYLTFCWNQCKETCGMCNQMFSTSATLHKHVRFVHNVTLEWYRSNHVTSVDDISTICLICNQSIQLTQKAMENHLRTQHSFSLMNYEEQFRTELSEQFQQLQTIRQSNSQTDEFGHDLVNLDHDDPLEMNEEESDETPNIADMIKTEINIEDEVPEGDEFADGESSRDQPDADEDTDNNNDTDDDNDDDDDDDDDTGFLEPEQSMIEGSDDAGA